MNMIRLKLISARLTTPTIVVLVLSGCSGKPMRRVVVPVPGPAFDTKFLIDRAHHSRETIGLIEGCAVKASRSEMQTLCQQARFNAEQEITAVTKLRAGMSIHSASADESDEHESELFRGFQKEMGKATGTAFDNALLRALRQHYRQGSEEAASCSKIAVQPDLQQFCRALFQHEENVLRQINVYICDWFKHCSDR